jgi:hypothetical protein
VAVVLAAILSELNKSIPSKAIEKVSLLPEVLTTVISVTIVVVAEGVVYRVSLEVAAAARLSILGATGIS